MVKVVLVLRILSFLAGGISALQKGENYSDSIQLVVMNAGAWHPSPGRSVQWKGHPE